MIHADGIHLHDHGIAETVDDHAGQAVGLGMDEAIVGNANQPVAQRHGIGELAAEEQRVDRGLGI